MKRVNEFFDWKRFSDGKEFQVVTMSAWKDYNDKSIVLGTMITCVITQDSTEYSVSEDTNLFEKIYFKIPAKLEIISKYIKLGQVVRPNDVSAKVTAKASGTFVNYNLSIECKGFSDSSGKKII